MVTKISLGKSLYGALAYNGEKINKEQGRLLATNRIFNDGEWNRFLVMHEKSGVYAKAVFLKEQFFGRTFRVVTVDKGLVDYYTKLSDFHAQFRAIGTNYNQVVKELRSHFSEKKAMALLYRLEKCTEELAALSRRIMELSKSMEEKWSPKSV